MLGFFLECYLDYSKGTEDACHMKAITLAGGNGLQNQSMGKGRGMITH